MAADDQDLVSRLHDVAGVLRETRDVLSDLVDMMEAIAIYSGAMMFLPPRIMHDDKVSFEEAVAWSQNRFVACHNAVGDSDDQDRPKTVDAEVSGRSDAADD